MASVTDVLFISHGGGPMPLLGSPGHHDMVEQLRKFARELCKPSAILVISAHWEESVPTITSGMNPSIIYDYYGFPSESYEIDYPCPGEPELAKLVYEGLTNAGIPAELDGARGGDVSLFHCSVGAAGSKGLSGALGNLIS